MGVAALAAVVFVIFLVANRPQSGGDALPAGEKIVNINQTDSGYSVCGAQVCFAVTSTPHPGASAEPGLQVLNVPSPQTGSSHP